MVLTTEQKLSKKLPKATVKISPLSVNSDAYLIEAKEGDTAYAKKVSGLQFLQSEKGVISEFVREFEELRDAV